MSAGDTAQRRLEPGQQELLVDAQTPGPADGHGTATPRKELSPNDIDQAKLDIKIQNNRKNAGGPALKAEINLSQELASEEFVRLEDGSPLPSAGKGSAKQEQA